jgi:hypothetical protein
MDHVLVPTSHTELEQLDLSYELVNSLKLMPLFNQLNRTSTKHVTQFSRTAQPKGVGPALTLVNPLS